MTKRDFEMKSDGLGIGLFAFGVFCAVLVVQAMVKGVDPEPTQFVKVVAALWVNSIGAFPSLVLNAALAAIGARMFLAGAVPGLVRHLVGVGFLAASLSILCGAFGSGGNFGARTGGALGDLTHVAVAALVGALAAIATVWFVWLQKDELAAEEPMTVRNPELAVNSTAKTSVAEEAVSTEEAEALLPVAKPIAKPLPTPPPSPYPEDVRRKGEIPVGARPLASATSSPTIPAANFAPSVYRWTAPGARQDSAATLENAEERDTTDDRYTLADEDVPPIEARADAEAAQKLGNLPRPVWEAEDEDPIVDAYGTPRSLREKLREDADDEELQEEVSEARPLASAPVAEDELDELSDEEPLDAPAAVVARDDEDELDEDEDDFDDEEEALADDDEDLDEDLSDADELAETLAEDDELEPALAEEREAPRALAANVEPARTPVVAPAPARALASADEDVAEEVPATAAVFHEADHDEETESADARRTALRDELRSLTFVTETDEDADEGSLEDELARAVQALDADDAAAEPVRVTVADAAEALAAAPAPRAVVHDLDELDAPLATRVAEPSAVLDATESAPLAEELDSDAADAPVSAVLDSASADAPVANAELAAPSETELPTSETEPAGSETELPASAAELPASAAELTAGAAEVLARSDEPETAGDESEPVTLIPALPETRSSARKSAKVEAPSLFDAPATDDAPVSSVFESADSATDDAPEEPARKRKSSRRAKSEPEATELEPVATALEAAPAAESEPTVVLTPHAVPAELTHKTPTGTKSSERTALLAEVGCLFIDRGRVAVSMLQRQYSMEFDDACKVLDELQDMGLIGPYLGGSRRDILLTREAWLEKVGAS